MIHSSYSKRITPSIQPWTKSLCESCRRSCIYYFKTKKYD